LSISVLPASAFITTIPRDPQALGPTPTPWPTYTLVPTLTATPTEIPWPVAPGTALPPVLETWWQAPEILRCTPMTSAPVYALSVGEDEVWINTTSTFTRYQLSTMHRNTEIQLPREFDLMALSSSAHLAALSRRNDIWLYALPEWRPVLRTRISTLSAVTVMAYNSAGNQIALGLETGHIWINDTHTGALINLIAGHSSPVTALAFDIPDRIYSGSQDGSINIWDYQKNSVANPYAGHSAEVQFLRPGDSELVSVDVSGRIIIWDNTTGQMLRERRIAGPPRIILALWDAFEDTAAGPREYVILGAAKDKLFTLDSDMNYLPLFTMTGQVTGLYPVNEKYLLVSVNEHQLCILGTPR
ncbi:MAG: WD40 repeat domain-containing protein, partial [Anaerolineae bacterium]|nr:WD40 repeat domain-containing protein [Anaerolineae bacterium]